MSKKADIYIRSSPLMRSFRTPHGERTLGVNFLKIKHTKQVTRVFDRYSGFLILRGSGSYTDDSGREYEIGVGNYIQHRPGIPFKLLRHDKTWAQLSLNVDAHLYAQAVDLGILDHRVAVMKPGVSLNYLKRAEELQRELREGDDSHYPALVLRLFGIYHDILLRCRQQSPPHAELVQEVCVKIREDLSVKADIDLILRQRGVSLAHFRRLFLDHMGLPLDAWRIEKRIEKAQNLLLAGNSVEASALELGYPDVASFSKQFKKCLGISPLQYLRSML